MTRLFFLLFVYLNVYSQELSPIQSFKMDDYNASGQNWMISQSSDGNLFFANNDGLLKYNVINGVYIHRQKAPLFVVLIILMIEYILEKILILAIGLKISMGATPTLQYL